MWVTHCQPVGKQISSLMAAFLSTFFHNLSHRINSLISPLTWGYSHFPQINGVVTTTTYNYIKTPVRFPFTNLKNNQLGKTCKVIQLKEG